MNPTIISNLKQIDFFGIFFLIFAFLFIIGYFVYAFVFLQRLQKLNDTYSSPKNQHLFALAWAQIAIAVILMGYMVLFFLVRFSSK